MAIIIVNEGPDKSVVKQVICRECGVTLQYVPNDVKKDTRKDYTGCSDSYNTINCVKCNHTIKVK